jgi:hypothetical protein
MVLNFGDDCCFITRFKSPENGVNDVSSSLKMDVWLWNEKKGFLFVIFGTSRWFCTIKCYKDHFESWKSTVLLNFTGSIQWCKAFCLFVLKKSRKWHCNGIIHCHHHPSKNKISFCSLNYLNFEYVTHACQLNTSAFTVGPANTHCVQKRGPTCQGIDALRHYPHTFIFQV